ncbi:hypothetical protein [Streptomyces sp. NPDC058739]|uniref:hypothetical protein n=1 Tax=Streptomyces sp. NPDC058739 TaxID=3346618 RepID=UPI0036A613B9
MRRIPTEEHRRAVRETVLEVTAALAAEHGLRGVTMSRIVEGTGFVGDLLVKASGPVRCATT